MTVVTKKDVDKAKAEWQERWQDILARQAEADAAWDKYLKLKREYENESESGN